MPTKKFVLLESKNGGDPKTIGGILVTASKDEDIYCSVKLQAGMNCIYFVSKDGSQKNLLEIVDFQQKAPFVHDMVPPYIYQLKLKERQ